MTVEIGGFIGLAALMVALFAWMRLDVKALREEMREEMRRMEERINDRIERLGGRIERLEGRLAAVEHGQARLEGLLEGLREAIAGRPAAE